MFLEREKLIARFKDYSKELEKILIDKPYSKTAKNLLLNMFYKIENSFEDYKKIKVEVPTKKEFMQELIDIIYKNCKDIEIIKPTLETDILDNNDCKVIENKVITYQNELSILEQLYKLNTNKFNIKMPNEAMGEALSDILNNGEEINKSEIIRDFDGWSWNALENGKHKDTSSLIYTGMTFILGYNTLNNNKKTSIEEIENILKEKYKPTLSEKIIKNISQIALLECIKKNPEEKKNIIKLKEKLKEEYEFISNKKKYIDIISNEKKKCIIESEKIDKYINNDLLLKKEYIKQNSKLPQEKRVFSLSDFSEKIQKQKNELQEKIEELTEKMKPNNYIKEKTNIEKEYTFYNEIDLEKNNIDDFIDEFISILLKALTEQINKATLKKEIIEKLYILRYLNLLDTGNATIGQKYKKQLNKTQKNLITIGCNQKTLTIFSQDVEENYTIYKNIFETRIIDLESVYVEVTKDNKLKIYDDEAIEKEEDYNKFKDLIIKYNKRYKIFI